MELGADFVRVHAGAEAVRYVLLFGVGHGCGMDARTLADTSNLSPPPRNPVKEPGSAFPCSTESSSSGGYITIESGLGRGTTFCMYLPRVDEVEEFPAPKTTPAARQQGSETVLVVEEEIVVRALGSESSPPREIRSSSRTRRFTPLTSVANTRDRSVFSSLTSSCPASTVPNLCRDSGTCSRASRSPTCPDTLPNISLLRV